MIYRLFAILTIVAIVVASLLLARQQGAGPVSTTVQENDWDEGYSARDAKLIETGSDGLPLYTLNAATIRQLPNQDQVQLTQVQMSFRDSDGNVWTATSDSGQLAQGTEQLQLAGNVHVSGDLKGDSGPAQIATSALSLDIRGNIVSTQDPVQLLWSGRQVSAIGLKADLKEHHVALESAVHGTFPQ
ncbi:MAG TPA: LPS export ABC transporter periplasmic protein LptC [Steroidobacteraceae bacterium]|nr:LPS export ABC transporter periplasmic protein LptC [Steroidobacteraceae bacterium]